MGKTTVVKLDGRQKMYRDYLKWLRSKKDKNSKK
ncbi:hypothetical protein JOC37_000051 [Desulfohalotomaculum tongense]|nr:hypothetical protein [Desulforadius tongensis]